MDAVIKATVVYFTLWAIVRVAGRRTLGQMTAFDFVLLLIIGGATQRAITGQDYSLTNALILVATFVTLDVLLSLIEVRSSFIRRILNATPTIMVEHGHVLPWRLLRARLSEEHIMEAARRLHGLERIDQIEYAILESSGEISIIPAAQDAGKPAPQKP